MGEQWLQTPAATVGSAPAERLQKWTAVMVRPIHWRLFVTAGLCCISLESLYYL
jgi:hypothetical protein